MRQKTTPRPKPKAPRRQPAPPNEYRSIETKAASRSENTADELPGGVRLSSPAPNAHSAVGQSHATVTPPSARAETEALTGRIPHPSPVDIEAALRRQPAQTCPSAKQPSSAGETWREAFLADLRMLRRFGELVIYSCNVVASHVLAAVLYAVCTLVFLLTIYEAWAPAKAIADAAAVWKFEGLP
jgi:hypothetical protein